MAQVRCNKCGSSWESKVTVSVCPFCSAPMVNETPKLQHITDMNTLLISIRKDFGIEVFKDGKRTIALMRDLAPSLAQEINLYQIIAKNNLFVKYEEAFTEAGDKRVVKLTEIKHTLKSNYFLAEEYIEKLESWNMVLFGVNNEPKKEQKPEVKEFDCEEEPKKEISNKKEDTIDVNSIDPEVLKLILNKQINNVQTKDKQEKVKPKENKTTTNNKKKPEVDPTDPEILKLILNNKTQQTKEKKKTEGKESKTQPIDVVSILVQGEKKKFGNDLVNHRIDYSNGFARSSDSNTNEILNECAKNFPNEFVVQHFYFSVTHKSSFKKMGIIFGDMGLYCKQKDRKFYIGYNSIRYILVNGYMTFIDINCTYNQHFSIGKQFGLEIDVNVLKIFIDQLKGNSVQVSKMRREFVDEEILLREAIPQMKVAINTNVGWFDSSTNQTTNSFLKSLLNGVNSLFPAQAKNEQWIGGLYLSLRQTLYARQNICPGILFGKNGLYWAPFYTEGTQHYYIYYHDIKSVSKINIPDKQGVQFEIKNGQTYRCFMDSKNWAKVDVIVSTIQKLLWQ